MVGQYARLGNMERKKGKGFPFAFCLCAMHGRICSHTPFFESEPHSNNSSTGSETRYEAFRILLTPILALKKNNTQKQINQPV